MPVYEFVCEKCGARFEKQVRFSEDPDHVVCPNGHVQTRRVFTPPTIVFKGKGFYVTDNRPSEKTSSSSG